MGVQIRKSIPLIAILAGLGVFAYLLLSGGISTDIIPFDRITSLIAPPPEEEAPQEEIPQVEMTFEGENLTVPAEEYEEIKRQLEALEEQPEPEATTPQPPARITAEISIVDYNTNEPLRRAWVYIDSEDTKCITGIEGTVCVQTKPDCITDNRGVCTAEVDVGEHSLLIKTFKDDEVISSYTESISVSAEGPEVTIRLPIFRAVDFEVRSEDLGMLLDDAEIHIDGRLAGLTFDGRLTVHLDMGTHSVLVKYTNPFGRDVTKEFSADVKERTENRYDVRMPVLSYEEIRDYALSLINADRERAGLKPLLLIDDKTAQAHAEEMAGEGYTSAWDTVGLKPYMRYTLSGGLHAVSENVALASCDAKPSGGQEEGCVSDVIETVKKLHDRLFMKSTESGRTRDNILNKWYNGAGIGVAYNSDFVALVQDFEGKHIEWSEPMSVTSDGVLKMSGIITTGDLGSSAITIYRDGLPVGIAPDILAEFYGGSYDPGKFVTMLDPSSIRESYRHVPDIQVTNKWLADEVAGTERFEISFSLSHILLSSSTFSNDGVYTIYLLAKSTAGEQISLTNYSLKYENGILSTLDGSELWRCNLIPKHKC